MRLLYLRSDPTAAGEIDEPRLTELYRHRAPGPGKWWLRTNFVSSLDGSVQGPDGRSGSINTPSDSFVFALHRAHADAIMVGAQTVRAEGYRAVDLAGWQRRLRAESGLAPFPLLVILSRSLDLDPGIAHPRRQGHGPVMIITTGGKRAAVAQLTAAGVDVVQLDGDEVDLVAATNALALAGHSRLLCEGGPHLHRALLAADLVDEISLTLAPIMVGGTGLRATAGDPLSKLPSFVPEFALLADDGTLFTNYVRPEAPSQPHGM